MCSRPNCGRAPFLALAMTTDENPYAAPRTLDLRAPVPDVDGGVWQDGRLLVVQAKGSVLPARCIKCNAPTDYRLKRRLTWHNPWLYVLLLSGLGICALGVLLYIVVAMIVRKTAVVYPGLCKVHRKQRRRAIWTAWLLILLAPVIWWQAGEAVDSNLSTALYFLGLIVFFGGAVYGALRSSILSAKKIDDQFAWLKGASPEFLSGLPVSPIVR